MNRSDRSRHQARFTGLFASVMFISSVVMGLVAAGAQADGSTRVSTAGAPGAAGSAQSVTPVANTKRKVKFYVVRDEFNGAPESLVEIAQRFLGRGDRAQEIFELNVGREQPDGAQMVRDDTIDPGWQLIMPDDAKGKELQVGEVAVTPPTTPPSTPTGNPPNVGTGIGSDTSTSPRGAALWIFGGGTLLLGLIVIAYALQKRRRRSLTTSGRSHGRPERLSAQRKITYTLIAGGSLLATGLFLLVYAIFRPDPEPIVYNGDVSSLTSTDPASRTPGA